MQFAVDCLGLPVTLAIAYQLFEKLCLLENTFVAGIFSHAFTSIFVALFSYVLKVSGCGFAGTLNILLSLLITSASLLCQFLAFHFPAAVCVLLLVLFSKKWRLTLFFNRCRLSIFA